MKMKNNNKVSNKKKYVGGEVIAAGGFGCIFKPQLMCENTKKYDKEGISKLMTIKNAQQEMIEINKINSITKNIPKRDNYFLLKNIYKCIPKPLENSDKINLNKKCNNLKKKNINERNINNKLDLLQAINMPYMGDDLDTFWQKWINITNIKEKNAIFNQVNNKLIELLKNGILKINEKKYYHTDIKGANILIQHANKNDKYKTNLKLIDWGLSEKYNNKSVLNNLINKPIQFNLPYGNILFTKYTNEIINKSNYRSRVANILFNKYDIMKIIALNIYNKVLKKIGNGHISYIYYMLDKIYKTFLDTKTSDKFIKNKLISYLTEILFKYVDETDMFNQDRYFEEVYRKNIDIWGFLMSYIDIPLHTKDPWNDVLSSKILTIIIEYCLNNKYAVEPIPVNDVIADLKKCNNSIIQEKDKSIFTSIPIFNTDSRNKNAGIDDIKSKKSKSVKSKSVKSKSVKSKSIKSKSIKSKTKKSKSIKSKTKKSKSIKSKSIKRKSISRKSKTAKKSLEKSFLSKNDFIKFMNTFSQLNKSDNKPVAIR